MTLYRPYRNCNFEIMQRCTMDLELRDLERASINLIPKIVMMESKTVLTQYIISKWSLEYKTESNITDVMASSIFKVENVDGLLFSN